MYVILTYYKLLYVIIYGIKLKLDLWIKCQKYRYTFNLIHKISIIEQANFI